MKIKSITIAGKTCDVRLTRLPMQEALKVEALMSSGRTEELPLLYNSRLVRDEIHLRFAPMIYGKSRLGTPLCTSSEARDLADLIQQLF